MTVKRSHADRQSRPEGQGNHHLQHQRLQKVSTVLLLLSSGMLLIFAAASGSFGYYHYDRAEQAERELREYKQGFSLLLTPIGTPVSRQQLEFVVDEVLIDTKGTKERPTPTGQQYVIVQFRLKNKTAVAVSFLPVFHTYLRDGNGVKYEISTVPTITQPTAAGAVMSGDTVAGQLGFTVPLQLDPPLKFYFDMAAFGLRDYALYEVTPTSTGASSSERAI